MKRDEQKEQRRELIIVKSTELFVKNGYSATKISDIAAAADMSVGLLFHYFKSKEKLLEELVRLGVAFTSELKLFQPLDPLDYFRQSLRGIFRTARNNPFILNMFVLMNAARTGIGIPDYIRDLAFTVDQIEYSTKIIRAGQRQGLIKPGDPALLAFTFWSAVQGVMEQIAMDPKNTSFPDSNWLLAIIKA